MRGVWELLSSVQGRRTPGYRLGQRQTAAICRHGALPWLRPVHAGVPGERESDERIDQHVHYFAFREIADQGHPTGEACPNIWLRGQLSAAMKSVYLGSAGKVARSAQ